MDKNALWKWLILLVMVLFSIGLVFTHGIPRGLDLVGGTSFVIEADTTELDKMEFTKASEDIHNQIETILENEELKNTKVFIKEGRLIIEVTEISPDKANKLAKELKDLRERNVTITVEQKAEELATQLKLEPVPPAGARWILSIDADERIKQKRKNARDRALSIIRNRVDKMGTKEPIIYPEPVGNRIIVQIPKQKSEEQEQLKNVLKRPAYLQFRLVHENNEQLVQQLFDEELVPSRNWRIVQIKSPRTGKEMPWYQYIREEKEGDESALTPSNEELERVRKFKPQPRHDLLLEKRKEKYGGKWCYRPYYVERRPKLEGDHITRAGVDADEFNNPYVTLSMDMRGAAIFGRVTDAYRAEGSENKEGRVGRQLAIVLDGTLYSAPEIQSAIWGGSAMITGNFTYQEARNLAIVLEAGSLPTPLKFLEERQVDPTLGEASIKSGIIATICGGIAVLVFMVFYYRISGCIANLALFLDMLLLPLGMVAAAGFLGLLMQGSSPAGTTAGMPVLTLPGIAGIVLTIGMAVDANVLIFERMREEFQEGKKLLPAINAGYEKAFSTIFDANITTLLTAVILFWQGSGPVRGFAITLSAGILVSMYTALVATRMFFNLLAEKTKITTLKMMSVIGNTKIDFISKRKVAAMASITVITITWVIFAIKGIDNLGVDFTGGSSLTFEFEQEVSQSYIDQALNKGGIQEAIIQYQRLLDTPNQDSYLEVKVGSEEGEDAQRIIEETFKEQGFNKIAKSVIGPQVGAELRNRGITAIIFALIGIVIYISFRFEFGFAMGAIVALLHDVLITIGIYCLLGRQLSLPIVAALLTIVGYSVNDTIVVFDRIREDLGLLKGRSYRDICNISINQTLSRTLLTSITTLLSVVMLLLLGGGAINDFALALFIGILVGTYSSIFVATPVVLLWHADERPVKAEKTAKNIKKEDPQAAADADEDDASSEKSNKQPNKNRKSNRRKRRR